MITKFIRMISELESKLERRWLSGNSNALKMSGHLRLLASASLP
jgi:hypothetical protein